MKVRVLSITSILALFACYSCTFQTVDDLRPEIDPCDTITVTWTNTIVPILTLNCANNDFNDNGDCHGAGSAIWDQTIYQNVKDKVDEGKIQDRALGNAQFPMPPAFTQGPPALSECDKKLIQRWIDDGAPEN